MAGHLLGNRPHISGMVRPATSPYAAVMKREALRRAHDALVRLSGAGLDWVGFSTRASETIAQLVPFDRSCWHTIDPGTVLITGSVNRNVGCSGTWLAEHEYVIEDVNKWSFLAHSGRLAGATSIATHGDLSRSPRHRSHNQLGIGDELRGSFVLDGMYWGAAGFLRNTDEPCYTEDEVAVLASLSAVLAQGMRRALLVAVATQSDHGVASIGPGVVVFDEAGEVESISPAAEHWLEQLVESPAPSTASESKALQAVAARSRALGPGHDPLELSARSRARTRSGDWLLLYGTRLAGSAAGRTAVIIQPAAPSEVAALVALAYGLTEREIEVTRLCLQGKATKDIARALYISPYTVQDHLKSIFAKTGVRTRGELIGQVFLEHVVPRWESVSHAPAGWHALGAVSPDEVRAPSSSIAAE